VLWKEHYVLSSDVTRIPVNTETTTWAIHVASERRDECERNQQLAWKGMLAHAQKMPGVQGVESASGMVAFRRGVTWERYTYTCVPDTVDPRGPKGK
jgi:hypothetical protein